MGARGLFKMVVALLALLFGAMVLVGDGPEVAMGSDQPELTSEELAELEAESVEEAAPETVAKAGDNPAVLATPEPAPEAPEQEPVLEASLSTANDATLSDATMTEATDAAVEEALAETEPTEPAAPQMGVILGRIVNVRSGPSTANGVIGQVVEDQEVEILGWADNGWAHILLDGEEGYMSGDFIQEMPQG